MIALLQDLMDTLKTYKYIIYFNFLCKNTGAYLDNISNKQNELNIFCLFILFL